jgi:hypothetical protein
MFIFAIVACLVLLAFAGADWLLSQFNSDELNSMGIQKR